MKTELILFHPDCWAPCAYMSHLMQMNGVETSTKRSITPKVVVKFMKTSVPQNVMIAMMW